ncbi:hypothetical protein Tco_1183438 [Tanacetum coccineum]
MADLIFVDSHNMMAYMEKSEDNADFAEIFDFLNAGPIRTTEISQSSRPTTLVADETVHEERGDSVERAATTATSLDAEQGRAVGRNKIDQDEGIAWFQEDSETQGRYGHDIEINTASASITTASINITTVEPVTTASAPITTVGVFVSTAEPSTPPTITILIEDKDLTITQTLMKMRSVKSKEKSKEKRSI